ncbi:MAG TPA: hypothetical protein VGN49_12570, partial [Micrococcaceae bacterium]|nr:hypothetical protein [Micrococcaceae bacterium]
FAWRGIGVVDHTEIDNGRLNIYSLAPDAAKAVAGIKTCIRDARLDYTKLSVGVAPYADPQAVKVKHMPPGSAGFQP